MLSQNGCAAADIPGKPGENRTNYDFIPVNVDGTINVRIKIMRLWMLGSKICTRRHIGFR